MFGVKFDNSTMISSPRMGDLVNHVMGSLELLSGDNMQSPEAAINQDVEMLSIDDGNASAIKPQASMVTSVASNETQPMEDEGDERKKALRIAKTGNPLL